MMVQMELVDERSFRFHFRWSVVLNSYLKEDHMKKKEQLELVGERNYFHFLIKSKNVSKFKKKKITNYYHLKEVHRRKMVQMELVVGHNHFHFLI
jgi:hypothetical protein